MEMKEKGLETKKKWKAGHEERLKKGDNQEEEEEGGIQD